MNKLFLVIMAFISIFSFTKSTAFADEDTGVQKLLLELKPAVVLIYVNIEGRVNIQGKEYKPKPIGGTGSGFIINPEGYLVTNGHVVANYHESNEKKLEQQFLFSTILDYFIPQEENKLGRKLSEQEKYLKAIELYQSLYPQSQVVIKKDLFVILSNGEPYPAEIKSYSPPLSPLPGKVSIPGSDEKVETGKDVAILKIEGRNLPIVGLGDSGNLQLGEPLYVIGFPGVVLGHEWLSQKTQLDATVSTGRVSGAKLDIKGTPVIQTDAPLTWGNSGGPAFNSKGEVIGVATFISISQEMGSPQAIQGFNFLVPVNTVKEFVRTSGVELKQESLFNKLWYEALDLYSQGRYKETLSKLDEVLRVVPNQPDARKLQVRTQELITTEAGKSRFPTKLVALVVLVVVVLAGLGMYLPQSRRKKETAPPPQMSTQIHKEEPGKTMPMGSLIAGIGAPYPGQTYTIKPSGIKIGRDPTKNHIVIDNEGVSREHAWVGIEGDRVVVKDLNSLNGTFINSTESNRIRTEAVKDGDVIIIGKGNFASFKYKAG